MKLLVLAPFPPRGDATHGGARWNAGLVARLAGSHRVGLVTLRGPGEQGIDPELAARCDFAIEVERVRARASLAGMWRERQRFAMVAAREPGWVVGFSAQAFGAEIDRALAEWRPDVVHVETVVMAQYAERLGALPLVVVDQDPDDGRRSMRRYRARVLPRADAVVALTDRDRAAISALAPSVRVKRIPLAVDVPAKPLDPVGNGRDVLFVGNFMHPPNVAAAERLAGSIFPRIADRRPDARLVLVGADPPASVRAYASDAVVVTGRVDDVRPFLDAAAVVAAPMASGGGMRVKVLEALAAGKALVASPLALEGVDVRPGEEALVEADDAAFADAVLLLLAEERRRTEFAVAARAWAKANVDWRPVTAAYDALYRSLLVR
jgi:glycosyltransferase involved in cell wall biosynthesis